MKPYLKSKDYFYTKEEFDVLFDPTTEMLVTSPIPENLASYYQSVNYISHSDQSQSLIDKLYILIKNYSIKRKVNLLTSLLPTKGSLLDIGAGTADFLVAAQKDNWDITGVEPNPLARTNATVKGISLYENLSAVPNPSYDIITLWHVLEHLPNINNQLTHITSLLKKGGFLIVAAPNYKSYDAHYYKGYWAAFDVPRHLWHFCKESIVKLLIPHGLELAQTKPMLFDAFYISLLSEKYKHGKNKYISALFRGFVSNMKGLASKEYSSHIYILKKQ
ncbi:class I SAM-dependent methyltransferase [Maribacter antarcticus]|uniref:class I SAM-dependent methyltransferase n=1 Tax=Maribacter antarcticus TaxID=505250 RepID=UPI00047A9BCD|nr:class I SAM-dependent methyltransferase [Maribacter antarcticus]